MEKHCLGFWNTRGFLDAGNGPFLDLDANGMNFFLCSFMYVSGHLYMCYSLIRSFHLPEWVKVAQLCLTLCDPIDYSPWNSPGQNTGVVSFPLLQGIFPTQGSNPGLPQCRQILYQLSHKRNSRILGWVAYPFSSRSSWPRNRTRFSCIAGGFFYQLRNEGSPKSFHSSPVYLKASSGTHGWWL